jgi:hypothetical protein
MEIIPLFKKWTLYTIAIISIILFLTLLTKPELINNFNSQTGLIIFVTTGTASLIIINAQQNYRKAI